MFNTQKFKIVLVIFLLGLINKSNATTTQGAWTQGNNFQGLTRAHFFQWIIGGKAYMGTGSYVAGQNLTFTRDVWEFDPVAGTWTQKADFGGNVRTGTLNFTVGNFGFAGCGADQFAVYNDFWKFDPAANTWTQIAYFPGTARVYGQGFGMDTVGFAGMGRTFTAAGSTVTYNDIYQYYPDSNQWSLKNSFPGIARSFASTFRVGNYNYLLAGQSGNATNQLWQYDASNDSWTQKTGFPAGNRIGMTALVIQDTAYAGFGRSQDPLTGITTYYNDFWMYDVTTDMWHQYTDLPASARFRAFGFGLDTMGYVGCGESVAATYNDTWWFNPRLTTTTSVGIAENEASALTFYYDSQQSVLHLNGMTGKQNWNVAVYNMSGQQVYHSTIRSAGTYELSAAEFTQGVYIINLSAGEAHKAFRFVK